MKGKFLVVLLGFIFCLWAFLIACAPLNAQEWTAEQKAVAESFQKLINAAVSGDMEELKSCWHPQISWWDYGQEHPVGLEVYTKIMEGFHKSGVVWVACDAKPLEIHVVDNVAIVYAMNKNIFKDSSGTETTTSGPWTAVLFKQDGNWLFLSNSWVEK